jgi:septal ring factor EnvC (AmiA/AmiB activator)
VTHREILSRYLRDRTLESLAKALDETRRILCSETERAQQAEVERGRAQAESVTLQERAIQAEAGTEALNEELDIIKERLRVLQGEHAVLQGSLRRFLRAYLPRLRRHLLGQRP